MNGERVVVGMSGGVDSSAAAALLRDAGCQVVGVTLRLWDEQCARPGSCCSPADIADARAAAAALGIPHYVVDEREAFEREVVVPFVSEHALGRTPSPCVHCNPRLKFAALRRFARAIGGSAVATGHYARVAQPGDGSDGAALLRGIDPAKDQSYFLYALPAQWLREIRYPVGGLTKPDVRALAQRLGLPTAAKRDSQQLCFVADGDHRTFVEARGGGGRPGDLVDEAGEILGHHDGTHRFTVGQRKGVPAGHRGERRFVLHIDPDRGRVVVGSRAALARCAFTLSRVTWLAAPTDAVLVCSVQIRYRATPLPARVTLEGGDRAAVALETPAYGVAPGQAAVFYAGDRVLGGGLID